MKINEVILEVHPNSKVFDKCWKGYKKVPGKKRSEKGSCEKIKETTSAGAVAAVAQPLGGTISRNMGVYNKPKKKKVKESKNFDWGEWSSTGYTTDQICELLEAHIRTGLLESNDKASVDYFLNLPENNSNVKPGELIAMDLLVLVNNKILSAGPKEPVKFVNEEDGHYIVETISGEQKKYPDKVIRDRALYKSFLFNDQDTIDKFKVNIALKFDTTDLNLNHLNIT